MYLKLTTPYNPGMNDLNATYPLIFITQLTDSRTGNNFQFIYEAGQFVTIPESTDAQGNVTPASTVWQKGPGMLSRIAQVAGADYVTATGSATLVSTDTPYMAIYRILYESLIAQGFAGTIINT